MATPLRPITTFRHVQETAATTWNIAHKLGDYPVVDAYIAISGVVNKVIPKTVVYVDKDNVIVTFTTAESGFATLAA